MYFPHAFSKMLVGTAGFVNGNGTLKSKDLTAGQIGVINSATNVLADITSSYSPAATYANYPMIYLAQGSFYASDKLGKFHGGYKESVKTKGINPKYVSKIYVTTPAAAKNEVVEVGCIDGFNFMCNSTYRLRIDLKGSPVLRYLSHNAYATLDAYTGCCDDPATPSKVDPMTVILGWKDMFDRHQSNLQPFVQLTAYVLKSTVSSATTSASATIVVANADKSNFAAGYIVKGTGIPDNTYVVSVGADGSGGTGLANVVLTNAATETGATVDVEIYITTTTAAYTPATGAAIDDVKGFLQIMGAYVDTKFGNCSFRPTDKYEIEPVLIYASPVDASGDPCIGDMMCVTKVQVGYQGKGYVEPLTRDLILNKMYRQEDWSNDVRLREVLGDTTLTELDRSASTKYYTYNILHSVPRKSNPSGTFDNDQYLVTVVVTARSTDFEGFMTTLLASAGNDMTWEVQ